MAESGKSPERNVRLAALMARIALGDQAAFAELYAQTSSHLYGVAVRILKDGALAEEVLQEAFVSVWHHAGSYDAAKSQPSTWLAAVIRNRCLDLIRRRELDTVTMTTDDDDGREFDLPSGDPTARTRHATRERCAIAWMRSMPGRNRRSRWRSTRDCRTPSWLITCGSRWARSSHGYAARWNG